jgi:aryl-alcohol dehydrogenase-like predicted oxidoreductase
MHYSKLGKTGLTVSRICLGCMSYGDKKWRDWVLSEDEAREHFAFAIEHGINFFDTADVYSHGVSEQVTGRWLGEMARRDDVVIATKVFGPMGTAQNRGGLSRKHIIEACEASLKRLKTDFIDLYQIHRWDFTTPIEETLEALDSVVRAGKVRYLGASSMAAWQFAKALFIAGEQGWHRFVAMQNHYNLVYREEEREMNPLCIDQGVGLIPWSPLARGFLSGNRKRGEGPGDEPTTRARSDEFARLMYYRDYDFDVVDAVVKVAQARKVTPTQVALAWILQAPGVTSPIIGTTKVAHLKEAVGALDLKLSGEEVAAVEKPYRPHPIFGHEQPKPALMVR